MIITLLYIIITLLVLILLIQIAANIEIVFGLIALALMLGMFVGALGIIGLILWFVYSLISSSGASGSEIGIWAVVIIAAVTVLSGFIILIAKIKFMIEDWWDERQEAKRNLSTADRE